MRSALFAAGCLLALGGAALAAPVSPDQFPPKTTRDFIALCSATKDDPLMTAAVNYCQGFAEGAVQVGEAYAATVPVTRKPFCLPSPPPSNDQALAAFTQWANDKPTRLDEPAVVGILHFVTDSYPCPRPAPRGRAHR